MTRGQDLFKWGKCKNRHCSSMSNSDWCDPNSKGDVLNIHDLWHKPKCKCQKQITFTPRNFQMEGGSIKNKLKSNFRGKQTAWY